MNGSRSNPPRPSGASSLDALNRSIEGLEARIEGLMTSSARVPPALAEHRYERPARSSEAAPRMERDRSFDPVAEIRRRQQAIEAGRNRRQEAPIAARTQDAPAPPQAAGAGHHDTRGLAGEITHALLSLRHELKKDISEGFARELGLLREEIRGLKSLAADRQPSEAMREDMARLAASIDRLGRQSPPAADGLRAEFEELRSLMDGLAREESVRGIETRWDGIESRLQTLGGDNGEWLRQEVNHLYDRLDEIKGQLTAIGDGRMIRALEDKLLAVANAIEDIGGHFDPSGQVLKDQFAGLDTRLDEISRAIVAGNSRAAPAVDPRMIDRLEERIAGIAAQIDRLGDTAGAQPDPTEEIALRLEGLSARIEELAENRVAAGLEERLDHLSDLIEKAPRAVPQPELADHLFDISRKIDSLEHNAVNDRLAEQLDHLARLIEHLGETAPVVQTSDLRGLEQQISRLVDHLEQPAPAAVDDRALRSVEDRLSQIAERLDETARMPAGEAPDLSGLEQQIARLSGMINAVPQATVDPSLSERLAKIEDYVATSDEYILEAARQAAETVMESYARQASRGGGDTHGQMETIAALADNLRHLEDLSRDSEERNQRTFESLQETLLQIADRLDSLHSEHDGGPATHREPAFATAPISFAPEAQSAPNRAAMPAGLSAESLSRLEEAHVAQPGRPLVDAPSMEGPSDATLISVDDVGDLAAESKKATRPSLLAGLGKRLMPGQRKEADKTTARQLIDPAPSIDPADLLPEEQANELLEPGSGAPDVRKILERVRASKMGQNERMAPKDEDADRTDYIAAARRAAQAAAQEAAHIPPAGPAAEQPAKDGASAFSRYRRPILLAAGAILLAVMAMPLVRTLTQGQPAPVIETMEPAAETETHGLAPPPADQPVETAAALEAGDMQAADAGTEATLLAPVADESEAADVLEEPQTAAADGAMPTAEAVAADDGARVAAYEVPAAIKPESLAKAAGEGDPLALFEIGSRYSEGRDVAMDLAEAARWYAYASDMGFAPAQYRLASLYEKGTGVQQDLGMAVQYYERAAAAGNASAMHNLAVLYASGAAGDQDYAKASEWFSKAAELGVSDSQFNLAILHARGNGAPQDLEASYKWFAIVAKDGDSDAAQKRDEVAKVLTPERLAALKAEVDAWQPQPLDVDANAVNVPDEWAGAATTTGTVDMKKAILNIQAILNKNGFDAGTPDGVMGKKTEAAIKAFQTSVGQEPNGRINDALVKELLARNK